MSEMNNARIEAVVISLEHSDGEYNQAAIEAIRTLQAEVKALKAQLEPFTQLAQSFNIIQAAELLADVFDALKFSDDDISTLEANVYSVFALLAALK